MVDRSSFLCHLGCTFGDVGVDNNLPFVILLSLPAVPFGNLPYICFRLRGGQKRSLSVILSPLVGSLLSYYTLGAVTLLPPYTIFIWFSSIWVDLYALCVEVGSQHEFHLVMDKSLEYGGFFFGKSSEFFVG